MTLQALLDNGDQVLIPAPDYPLWTACTSLAGGTPVHYLCDETQGWMPDIVDLESKITDRTKAIVVINPNNPTGAVYTREILTQMADLARKHQLLLLADEIYDKILYDGAKHIAMASVAPDVLTLTFNGLSKAYRVAGYRSGWLVITGPKEHAESFIEGISLLANMRLCPNVPAPLQRGAARLRRRCHRGAQRASRCVGEDVRARRSRAAHGRRDDRRHRQPRPDARCCNPGHEVDGQRRAAVRPGMQKLMQTPPPAVDYFVHPTLYDTSHARAALQDSGTSVPRFRDYLPAPRGVRQKPIRRSDRRRWHKAVISDWAVSG